MLQNVLGRGPSVRLVHRLHRDVRIACDDSRWLTRHLAHCDLLSLWRKAGDGEPETQPPSICWCFSRGFYGPTPAMGFPQSRLPRWTERTAFVFLAILPACIAVAQLGRLHPDEVYQLLEPGFYRAFGYG